MLSALFRAGLPTLDEFACEANFGVGRNPPNVINGQVAVVHQLFDLAESATVSTGVIAIFTLDKGIQNRRESVIFVALSFLFF